MKKTTIIILMSLMLVGLVIADNHFGLIQPSKTLDNNIEITKVNIIDKEGVETMVIDFSGTSDLVYNRLLDCGFPESKRFEVEYNTDSEAMINGLPNMLETINLSDPYLCNEEARPRPIVESNIGKQYDFDTGTFKRIGEIQQI